jgi:uncharacterized membrane protein YjdF
MIKRQELLENFLIQMRALTPIDANYATIYSIDYANNVFSYSQEADDLLVSQGHCWGNNETDYLNHLYALNHFISEITSQSNIEFVPLAII